mmetsp:Transcript_52197/g.86584  ORF Transcript_52197/g.86584 Transcript_52197/m.86584 type:complete len:308 (-) Transcript_52197:192-1115(-)
MFGDFGPPKPPEPRKIKPPHPLSEKLCFIIRKTEKEMKLGIFLDITETEMQQKRPIVIKSVVDGMAAKAAGIQAGDIIVAVNKHELTVPGNVGEFFLRALVGDVEIIVLRPPPKPPYLSLSTMTRGAVSVSLAAIWIAYSPWQASSELSTRLTLDTQLFDPAEDPITGEIVAPSDVSRPNFLRLMQPLTPLVICVVVHVLLGYIWPKMLPEWCEWYPAEKPLPTLIRHPELDLKVVQANAAAAKRAEVAAMDCSKEEAEAKAKERDDSERQRLLHFIKHMADKNERRANEEKEIDAAAEAWTVAKAA